MSGFDREKWRRAIDDATAMRGYSALASEQLYAAVEVIERAYAEGRADGETVTLDALAKDSEAFLLKRMRVLRPEDASRVDAVWAVVLDAS